MEQNQEFDPPKAIFCVRKALESDLPSDFIHTVPKSLGQLSQNFILQKITRILLQSGNKKVTNKPWTDAKFVQLKSWLHDQLIHPLLVSLYEKAFALQEPEKEEYKPHISPCKNLMDMFFEQGRMISLTNFQTMIVDPRGRPQARPVVITIFTRCPYVRHKTSKSSDNHCRPELWAGQVDH